jgi:hypothetical protein
MVFVTMKCGNKECGKDVVVAFEEKNVKVGIQRWECPCCSYSSPLPITVAKK